MFENQFASKLFWWLKIFNSAFSILVLMTIVLIQVHGCARKQKNQRKLSLTNNSNGIWMEFDILLRPAGLMNFMLILSCQINIQLRELINWFCPKKAKKEKKTHLTLACIQTFTDWFLSNLAWWWMILTPHFDTTWIGLDLSSRHKCTRKQNFCNKSLTKFLTNLGQIWSNI